MQVKSLRELATATWPDVAPLVGQGLLLPASRLLIAGRYKARKSFLAIQLGLELAAGQPVLGVFEVPNPVNVLYINAEIQESSFVIERVLPMSASYPAAADRFYEAFTNYKLKVSSEQFPTWVALCQAASAKVLIIDPLSEVAMGDENNKTDAQRVGDLLNSLIDELGVAIVLIHHEGKGLFYEGKKVERGFDAVRGSSYWLGWLDSGITVTPSPKGTHWLNFLTRHSKEPDPLEVRWDEESKLFTPVADQALSNELIRSILEGHSGTMFELDILAEVARKGLVSVSTVRRRLDAMVVRGEVTRQAWDKDKRRNVLSVTSSSHS